MKNTIDTIIHRTQRYWYVDGLAEITVGVFFMMLSVYFFVQSRIRTVSLNPVLANLGLLAVILIVLLLFRYALQTIKTRVTYPRTGYVAFPGMQKSLRWQRYGITAWLAVVCISLIVLALHSHTTPSWTPLLLGAVAGLTVLVLSYRFRLLRFTFLACALVLIGVGVSWVNPGETLAEVLSSAANGICFIISGGLTLVRYLRSTQPPTEENL
jgi:hypothetical protein